MYKQSETVNKLREKIKHLIGKQVDLKTPGIGLSIYHNNEIIFSEGYGLSNLSEGINFSPKTKVYIASLTKQFTAFGIALLIERGKLSLNDNIKTYLTTFPDLGVEITIGNLLYQTSGLQDYIQLFFLLGFEANQSVDHITDEDAFDMILRQKKLLFKPGEKYSYSNTNYFLLAKIIEVVSNKKYHTFMKDEIFIPLNMKDSYNLLSSVRVNYNYAIGYKLDNDSTVNEFLKNTTLSSIMGASGMISTLNDLAKWEQNFHNNILGIEPEKISKLIVQPSILNNGETNNYTFGLINGKYKGLSFVQHTGQFASLISVIYRFPSEKLSIIMLTNLNGVDVSNICLKIADFLLEDKLELEISKEQSEQTQRIEDSDKNSIKKEITSEKIKKFEGIYRSVKTNIVVTFEVKNGKLYYFVPNKKCRKAIYKPISETEFYLEERGTSDIYPSPKIKFQLGENKIDLFFVYSPEQKSHYKKFEVTKLTTEQLREYNGSYYSERLDALFTFVVEDEKLVVKLPAKKKDYLFYVDRDEFVRNNQGMVFQRNAKEEITGLLIQSFNERRNKTERKGIFCKKIWL